jgi:hypothetical protein
MTKDAGTTPIFRIASDEKVPTGAVDPPICRTVVGSFPPQPGDTPCIASASTMLTTVADTPAVMTAAVNVRFVGAAQLD